MILPTGISKVLALAVKKCQPNDGFKQWCGPLTPSEILALDRAGVRLKQHDIDRAIHYKRSGISLNTWVYFNYKDGEFNKLKDRLS